MFSVVLQMEEQMHSLCLLLQHHYITVATVFTWKRFYHVFLFNALQLCVRTKNKQQYHPPQGAHHPTRPFQVQTVK